MAELPQARREEGVQPAAEGVRMRMRHHQSQVGEPRRDRVEDRVVRRVHEDLAEIPEPLEALARAG